MPSATPPRRLAALIAALVAAFIVAMSSPASAHSLDSSSIWVQAGEDDARLTISFALETFDQGYGTGMLDTADGVLGSPTSVDLVATVTDHLTLTDGDGAVATPVLESTARETVEGIESFTVVFRYDGVEPDEFTISYDLILDVVAGHEAVVVLSTVDGDISTPGVLTSDAPSLTIAGDTATVGVVDMVRYGFDHVLEGADHLLFLLTLLLPAPLVAAAGRWRRGGSARHTFRRVVHVVTAFTLGHSLTLIASTLGWVSLPSRPVEIAIAVSVGVSALHAIRPLARRGEEWIAAGFGLVHGLAFAGILTDLGIDGSTGLLTLLAFNVGVELSQLATTALVFPSLYVLSTTRWYPAVRIAGASLALAAAVGWSVDRLGWATNPLAWLEDAAITHRWWVVVGLAALAAAAKVVDRSVQADSRLAVRLADQCVR